MNAARRLVLRFGGGASFAYALVARVAAVWLRMRTRGTVFVSGGVGRGEVLPGVSDIDLVVVAPGARTRPGALSGLVQVEGHDPADLRTSLEATALTYGLRDGTAVRPHDAGAGRLRMLESPGLYGPMDRWRRLAGPPLALGLEPRDRQGDRIAAWMTLQAVWRHAYRACAAPEAPWVAYLCVKLVADPARAWLWLAAGERAGSRVDVLERARAALPDESEAFTSALDLHRRLRFAPEPPLDAALGAAARLTDRVGRLVSAEAFAEGTTEVALFNPAGSFPARAAGASVPFGSAAAPLLPFADWFALAYSAHPDAPLARADGPPTAAHLAAAGASENQKAVPFGDLVLLPVGSPSWRARMRAVQCAATDPVTTALLAGRSVARFPDAAGWSARDWARRAVNEQRAMLAQDDGSPDRVLAAARAALFRESVDAGAPRLALTLADAAILLAERVPAERAAVEAYTACRRDGTAADPAIAAALARAVRSLPDYDRAT